MATSSTGGGRGDYDDDDDDGDDDDNDDDDRKFNRSLQVDGVLCSGPSPENMASTVVDTRRMIQGQLSFFRIGVVPRAHVESVFNYVKARFDNDGPTLPPSITDTTTGGQVSLTLMIDVVIIVVVVIIMVVKRKEEHLRRHYYHGWKKKMDGNDEIDDN